MKLYTYFRSSAAYRVRIALALKGIAWENAFVHLVKGEHLSPDYRSVNVQGRVPSLDDDGEIILQSPAILEYLEETHPEPPLLPGNASSRARIRAVCAIIGCDIHPLNNLSTLKYLKNELGVGEDARNAWYAHWIHEGFAAIEQMIEASPYCFGPTPTMADAYLIPQIYNAARFSVSLEAFPKIRAVAETCAADPAFQAAAPENQPDAA